MMRAEQILRTRFSDSDDSGSDSDSSMRSGPKKVQFEAPSNINKTQDNESVDKTEVKKKLRAHKKNGLSALKINRGDIPDGSDLFRQVLKEIQTESEDECSTPRSDCSSTKPLKSILKRKSDL